jgi:phosphatidylglycerol---prolipoprotein diacylglyceryl transferase
VHPTMQIPGLGWTLPTYTAMLVLAVLVPLWAAPRRGRALEGIDPRAARRVMLALAVVAFAGGRLHLVANYWTHYAAHPDAIPKLWAGLHAGGAVVAVAVALPLLARRAGVPAAKFADALVPASGVGIALARLGCFLHGCCYGTPCSFAWCLSFPQAPAARVHPLQLYFAAAGLFITGVGVWLSRRKAFDGEVALVALVLFSGSAAWLETFRADIPQRVYWGARPELEWIALALTAISLSALVVVEAASARRIRRRLSASC